MIIVCKKCKASFLVPSTIFAKGGKKFRCAKCGHIWEESPPAKQASKAPQPFSPPPKAHIAPIPVVEQPAPEPVIFTPPPPPPKPQLDWARIRRLTVMGGAMASAIFFLSAFIFIAGQPIIITHWPQLQPIYVALGIATDPLRDAIVLKDITSSRRYQDGAMHLVVEGNIVSHAKTRQVIPAIIAEALAPDGHVIESWRIDPPKATIDPEMSIPFSSAIPSPKETAVEVTLNFAEQPDE